MKKEALVFIKHILESINRIESFIKGVSEESFMNNEEKQSAVVRQLEIIGEAVKNIPLSFRKKYHHTPWSKIAGMRDKLMHHYFGVNLKIVWKVVKDDIPGLKENIKEILEKETNAEFVKK